MKILTEEEILFNQFKINDDQYRKINTFLKILKEWNQKFNIVGNSTLKNPLKSHIIDSIQTTTFIKNKMSKIIDLGTGGGLPGIVLSIVGYEKITLIDSNSKKINFINHVIKELNLNAKTINSRIENIKNSNFTFIVSRALARLEMLISYSSRLSNPSTTLIFHKGENYLKELNDAKKFWVFNHQMAQSISDERGKILIIKNFRKKHG